MNRDEPVHADRAIHGLRALFTDGLPHRHPFDYEWKDLNVPPPIEFGAALKRAESALQAQGQGNRYCLDSPELWGDPRGDVKHGAWHMLYIGSDGSRKHVCISMQGEATISEWSKVRFWEEFKLGVRSDQIQWPAGGKTLEEARRRIEDLLAQRKLKASVELQDDVLTVAFRTRPFEVYPWNKDRDDWEQQPETEIGPQPDGFFVRFHLADAPTDAQPGREQLRAGVVESSLRSGRRRYWEFLTTAWFVPGKTKRVVTIESRYGPNADAELIERIRRSIQTAWTWPADEDSAEQGNASSRHCVLGRCVCRCK